MISLKKLLESHADPVPSGKSVGEKSPLRVESDARPIGLLAAYQGALAAMGANGQRAVPVLGSMIQAALARISERLSQSPTPEEIRESRRMVEEQLTLWADKAQDNQKESEQTIRNLLTVIAQATESSGTRDEKFSHEISELSSRLRTVAGLDSLPVMRRSINESASALTSCVARMADEGRESVRKLTSEIAEYQTRLMACERRALIDTLTGLCNRRGFEQQLEASVKKGKPFSLLVADLNGFKRANDRYGHLVGDEILKQFAGELKAQFQPDDTVARWGGDEFVCIVSGSVREVSVRADRVRHWVLGEYKVSADNQSVRIVVDAALGTMSWNGVESGLELFARADKEMYKVKERSGELV